MKRKSNFALFLLKQSKSYNSKCKTLNTKKNYQFCNYQEDILTFSKLFLFYFCSKENPIKINKL